jgi:hypothetical protein
VYMPVERSFTHTVPFVPVYAITGLEPTTAAPGAVPGCGGTGVGASGAANAGPAANTEAIPAATTAASSAPRIGSSFLSRVNGALRAQKFTVVPHLLLRDRGFLATNLTMLLTERVGKCAQASSTLGREGSAEKVSQDAAQVIRLREKVLYC